MPDVSVREMIASAMILIAGQDDRGGLAGARLAEDHGHRFRANERFAVNDIDGAGRIRGFVIQRGTSLCWSASTLAAVSTAPPPAPRLPK
jgi:hypothetical protein